MSDCILWAGKKDDLGYGLRYASDRPHRKAYRDAHGEIPSGLDVMHLCHNPSCINPEHLAAGTRKENMQTSRLSGRLQRRIPLDAMPSIRTRREAGETLQSIGNDYGCAKQAVRHMLLRGAA